MRSLECYFGVYFPRCCATREINIKITLLWAHKQFATRVHTLFNITTTSLRGQWVKFHVWFMWSFSDTLIWPHFLLFPLRRSKHPIYIQISPSIILMPYNRMAPFTSQRLYCLMYIYLVSPGIDFDQYVLFIYLCTIFFHWKHPIWYKHPREWILRFLFL